MKESRFLSAEIGPAKDTNVDRLKQQALRLVQQEMTEDRKLREDASTAILTDYKGMGADTLLMQLCVYSLILDALKYKRAGREMGGLLADLLRTGIHKVDGSALDAITLRRDAFEMNIAGKTTLIGSMNSELLSILSLGKEHRETERRLTLIDKWVGQPDKENIVGVSRAIKVSVHDMQQLTRLIGNLFDERGHFIRHEFDAMMDGLVRYGNPAFELLWGYFKVLGSRANRVAFLNSLQHLISRINRPKHALRLLLSDFCRFPDTVALRDRNTIMLANILMRTYNKELDVDIEMTPEEVLNIRNGLDQEVVKYAQFRVDALGNRFSTKIQTIHENIIARFNAPTLDKQSPSVRHLLFLEREIFIFLALLAGKTARGVLISALNEYGNPHAGIYRNRKAAAYIPVFLQQLKIIVRGVGRVGTQDDVDRLRQIGKTGMQLCERNDTPENQRSVLRTVEWIERVIRGITSANWRSN